MTPPILIDQDMLPPAAGGLRGGHEVTPVQVAMQNKWGILAFATLVAALAYLALQMVRPLYTANASIMIDARQLQLMGAQQGLLSNQTLDEAWTRTQMEVLNSPRLAVKVVQALDLEHNVLFESCTSASGVLDRVRALLQRSAPPVACVPSEATAVKILLGTVMGFSNDRQSYIIKVSATLPDPDLAARIANAYAETYVDWQRDANRMVADKADAMLTPYLEQLRLRAAAADAAVEQYRQTHDLVQLRAGEGNAGLGQTLRSQSLSQANTELSAVTGQLAEKQGLVQQIQALLRSGGQVDTISPVLASPVIQALLGRHADLAGTLDELRTRAGNANPQVAAAQAQLARNEQQIRAGMDRTVAGLSGEVGALAARKAALAARVAGLESSVAAESRDGVMLQGLERAARADNSVYETLLVRLKQIGAERLVALGETKVVVEATTPDFPTFPKKRMMVAGAFLASLGIGTGLAFARNFLSRRFRNAEQVEDETGLLVLGLFPASRSRPAQDVVADAPFSLEAESVHSVLTQVCGPRPQTGKRRGRVVLVTSALPGEGKTTFSVALGRSSMQSGLSTFVLDCDLRRPSLERAILGHEIPAGAGVDAAALSPAAVIARASVDARSGMRFLPLPHYVPNPRGVLAWPGLPNLLEELRAQYDLIVLDTPPVLAVSDVLQLGPLADQVLMVIDWRGTPRPAVAAAVRVLQRSGMPATGAVISKVNLRRYAKAGPSDMPYLKHYRGYHDRPVVNA